MTDPAETGPIEGEPEHPGPQTDGDWAAEYRRQLNDMEDQVHKLQDDNRRLRERLDSATESRYQLTMAVDYLAAKADADHERYIECDWGEDEDSKATVLIADPLKPNTFHRIRFTNTGEVARTAAVIDDLHTRIQMLLMDSDEVVDATILPEWADTVAFNNLAGVTLGPDTRVVSLLGHRSLSPSQAMVTAAWLVALAGMNLDDPEVGFQHILEKVRSAIKPGHAKGDSEAEES